MRQLLGCPQGHQWKYWGEFDPSKTPDSVNCPICGSTEVIPVSETILNEATLNEHTGTANSSLNLDQTHVETGGHETSMATLDLEGHPQPKTDESMSGTLVYEEPSQATIDLDGKDAARRDSDSTAIYTSLPPDDEPTVNESANPSAEASSSMDQGFSLKSQLSESPDKTANWSEDSMLKLMDPDFSLRNQPSIQSDQTQNWSDTNGDSAVADSAITGDFSDTHAGEALSREPTETDLDFETEAIEWPTLAGYEILSELGRGGMGVVYKARQSGLNRLVAIKMILGSSHATPQELIRFQIEAEAVAQLQHPNIVQIYEIGKHNGRPFFSLEFLEGDTLSRKISKTPPTAKEAAILVRALADAMDFAHRRGIIHRDLKPANVLMAKNGEPKITDFGLAKKLEEDVGHTRTGAIMGTPSYMAPEQAEGKNKDIGPPADIYSLGAILYDLLTGRPPFRGETVLDTLNQVRSDDPVPPRRLQPKIPRDLQTICLTCLHKDFRKRYTSAGAMAEDLRRFLSGEPILARPTPAWERTWKWSKRRPAAAALVAVCALGIVGMTAGGFVYADYQRRNAEYQRSVADKERELKELAEAAQARAERNFQHAQSAVQFILTRVGTERLANEPRMEKIRRDVLGEALKLNQALLQEKSDDPRAREEVARAYANVGEIYQMLKEVDNATGAYQNAINAFGEMAKSYPERPFFRAAQASSLNKLGTVLSVAGRNEEAQKAYRESLKIEEALATEFPDDADYSWMAAQTHNNLGIFFQRSNRFTEAEAAYVKAKKLLAGLPDKSGYLFDLASASMNLGVLLQATGKTEAAEENYRLAIKLRKKLLDRDGENQEFRNHLANSHLGLATLLQTRLRFSEAEPEFKSAIDLFMRLAKEFPHTPEYQQMLAHGRQNLGVLFAAQKKTDEAERLLKQAIQGRKDLMDSYKDPIYQKELADGYCELGKVQANSQVLDVAEDNFLQAADLMKKLEDAFPKVAQYWIDHANHRNNLAVVYKLTRRWPEQQKSLLEVVRLQKKLIDASPKSADLKANLGNTFVQLADSQLQRGDRIDAKPHLEQAIANYRAALQLSPALAGAQIGIIQAYVLGEQHVEAFREAKEFRKKLTSPGPESLTLAALLSHCAAIAAKDEALPEPKRKELAKLYGDEAIPLIREALAKKIIDIPTLFAAPEFNPLSDRDDFKDLGKEKSDKAVGR